MSDEVTNRNLPVNTSFLFLRCFWGLLAIAFAYLGTKTGVAGDDEVQAVSHYIFALACLVAVVYFSIAARLNRIEARLILQSQGKDTA